MMKSARTKMSHGSAPGTNEDPSADEPSSDYHHGYDVFLSFRGVDTRNGFTGHLFGALDQMGIYTFVDSEELQKGDEISHTLIEAIKSSRIAIVVFSEKYAASRWCLDEVAQILECKKSKGQIVKPIFYNVDPRDVRKQRGLFKEAFEEHERKYCHDKDKVKRWRDALLGVGLLSGWRLNSERQEYSLIQDIVKDVLSLLNHKPLHVPANLVGMKAHLKAMSSLLDLEVNDVRMVGICGTGGLGKTTIAKAIYNENAHKFRYRGFLANVRETCQASLHNGLLQLQQTLFSQILGDNFTKIGNIDRGARMIKSRFCSKKTLLVIDDVVHRDQIEKLAGGCDWFGVGSRIIITTRVNDILENHNVQRVYHVPPLKDYQVKELLTRALFQDTKDRKDYEELSIEIVKHTHGLPLTVRVLGSSLRGKSKPEWMSTLNRLKIVPHGETFDTLKISFNSLSDNEKDIFLHIACFFKGQLVNYVRNVLESCDLYPDAGIGSLISKSLIYIKQNKVDMHDMIQEMGWEIVRQESPKHPGERSRLWNEMEILQVLRENTGTKKIEGIKLDFLEPKEVNLSSEAFKQMTALRVFIARNARHSGNPIEFPDRLRWLEWPKYCLPSLPLDDNERRELVGLHMSESNIKLIEDELKRYSNLKFINFSYCTLLKKIPDLSSISGLENLEAEECSNLVEVHQSLGYLDKLVRLNFSNCHKLRTFAFSLKSKALRDLILKGCCKLFKFPDILVEMKCVTQLCLNETAIEELPPSIENLIKLKELYLEECKYLRHLPSSIYDLKDLERFSLDGCLDLAEFPQHADGSSGSSDVSKKFPELIYLGLQRCGLQNIDFINYLDCHCKLKILDLSESKVVTIPEGISKFSMMQQLSLTNCKQLQGIEGLPPNIKIMSARGCGSLKQCVPLSKVLKSHQDASLWLRRFDFAGCRLLTQIESTMVQVLSTQDLLGDSRVEILHQGSEVPELFHHESKERSVSFSLTSELRQKIAGLAFCAVIGLGEQSTVSISCEIQVNINNQIMYASTETFPVLNLDHTWFVYVPCAMMWGWDAKLQEGHNQLKTQFEVSKGTLKSCAVHLVHKKDKQTYVSLNPMNLHGRRLRINRSSGTFQWSRLPLNTGLVPYVHNWR